MLSWSDKVKRNKEKVKRYVCVNKFYCRYFVPGMVISVVFYFAKRVLGDRNILSVVIQCTLKFNE